MIFRHPDKSCPLVCESPHQFIVKKFMIVLQISFELTKHTKLKLINAIKLGDKKLASV